MSKIKMTEEEYSFIRDLSNLETIRRIAIDICPSLSNIIEEEKFKEIMNQFAKWIVKHYDILEDQCE